MMDSEYDEREYSREELLEALKAVRISGKTNMLDRNTVSRWAFNLGYKIPAVALFEMSDKQYMSALNEMGARRTHSNG